MAVSSMISIFIVYRRNPTQELALTYAWKLIKGITASLAFAIAFYVSLKHHYDIVQSIILATFVWIAAWIFSEAQV